MQHLKPAIRRSSVWRASFLALAALLGFVGLGIGAENLFGFQQLQGASRVVVGVVLALIPALLWMFIFYLQDRLEPEPVGEVGRMFVIGLALAGALSIPFTDQLFGVWSWLYRDRLTTVLGSILLLGGVEAFTVYAAVRYFMFDSPEFDERIDGVIYATAAALGLATARNFQFILSNQGAAIGSSLVYMVEVALAYAAFGGVLGYFLGRAKLERDPIWWLPLGVMLTAALNGAFRLLSGQVDPGTVRLGVSGAGLPSLAGLALAGLLAVAVAGLVFFLIQRDIRRTLQNTLPGPDADRQVGDAQANLAVLGLLVVFILGSMLTYNLGAPRSRAFEIAGVRGVYPSNYSLTSVAGQNALRFADPLDRSVQISLAIRTLQSGQDAGAVISLLSGERGTDYEIYRVLQQSPATLAGHPALMQRFGCVSAGLSNTLPRVWEGMDIVAVDGGRAVVLTLIAAPETLAEAQPVFDALVKSLTY